MIFVYLFQICSLLRGGIAERGGVRVGHRIIEINNNSVVAVQHEKIVNMLATSVGEVSTFTVLIIVKLYSQTIFWPRTTGVVNQSLFKYGIGISVL